MKNILRDITESWCNESSNGNLFRAALCAILLGIGLVNGAWNYAHFKIDGRYEKKASGDIAIPTQSGISNDSDDIHSQQNSLHSKWEKNIVDFALGAWY